MTSQIPAPCQCDRLVEKRDSILYFSCIECFYWEGENFWFVFSGHQLADAYPGKTWVQNWRRNILKVSVFNERITPLIMYFLLLRLVHLDKLRLATRREESEILFDAGGKDPDIIVKAASESKGGVIEKLIKVDENSFSLVPFFKKLCSDLSWVRGWVLLRCLYQVSVWLLSGKL